MSPIWHPEFVIGPDVKDKQTVLNFANMSEDAHKPGRDDPEWLDVGDEYSTSLPFGWEDSGIRGHVFSDDTNSTVILSVKGTTVAMFEGNGTSGSDKDNDNLFGSCCCGQGGPYLWRQVCDCKTGAYTCDQKCVKEELLKPNRYFEATLELYDEVIQLYPKASIIATGHSLGGVLASFIGLRHGIPAVTFEAYPQALAATRLGLNVAGQDSPLRENTEYLDSQATHYDYYDLVRNNNHDYINKYLQNTRLVWMQRSDYKRYYHNERIDDDDMYQPRMVRALSGPNTYCYGDDGRGCLCILANITHSDSDFSYGGTILGLLDVELE
ncbi:putative lipase atg15 [Kalmusia sp. IMI 367209]|nr:putative lipase atg15 [Kalmusia sp. IMI 367209]